METKDILKSLRKSKGYSTMQEFCSAIGISFSTYQNYESGKRIPTADILLKLADFYGVTTDYLLGRDTGEPETLDKLVGEFNMSALEKEILDNYLSLPKDMRSDLMEFLQKSVKKVMEESESVQSNAQKQIEKSDTYNSEWAIARSSDSNYKPAPTEEQYNSFDDLTDDMLGE